ncbi:DUF2752 domain-containing protein [Paludicola sp. MB14-C6]|uniref:DUF2752 domain-containing protein n=1 Tax=Paludihabitans sp. MB14-C6 TaxID=3070656 RepID=UPI0027DD6643|nr:DUF2752 domain-containing protein [Paludicola sp. MB14-C6]WMJ24361.1 DUF2752 domain-containing protein [Paludicola sp. MB14-C6]
MKSQLKKLFVLSIIYGCIAIFILVYAILIKHGYGIACLFQKYFGISCLSCGATRAFFSLLHFDLISAIAYNAVFALVIYPFTALLILQDYIVTIVNVVCKKRYQSLASFIWSCMQKETER